VPASILILRIYLDSGNTITRSREKTSYKSSNNTLTQATSTPPVTTMYFTNTKNTKRNKRKTPRNGEYGKYTQYYCTTAKRIRNS
jgi:hypothetical protein